MAGWAVRQVMIAGFLPDVTDNVYQRCMRVVWQGMAGGAQGWGVEGLGCVVGWENAEVGTKKTMKN